MTRNYYGFPCPECDGPMENRDTVRAGEGKYMLRDKRCRDCGFRIQTIEFMADLGIGIRSFDPEQRFRKRENDRKRLGYHAVWGGHPTTPAHLFLNPTISVRRPRYLCACKGHKGAVARGAPYRAPKEDRRDAVA